MLSAEEDAERAGEDDKLLARAWAVQCNLLQPLRAPLSPALQVCRETNQSESSTETVVAVAVPCPVVAALRLAGLVAGKDREYGGDSKRKFGATKHRGNLALS